MKEAKLNEYAQYILKMKYLQPNESFKDMCVRLADTLKQENTKESFKEIYNTLINQQIIFGGRILASIGIPWQVTTPFNCFQSSTIHDSMAGITQTIANAGEIMRFGGGVGYNFSTIRPKGMKINKTGGVASGPVSFLPIFDALCGSISCAGQRRGAQMGIMDIHHPDILEFIRAKRNNDQLKNFNLSIGISDEFMSALKNDSIFELYWKNEEGQRYSSGFINPKYLWNEILRSAYDYGEPGVVYIGTMNRMNNLNYVEKIVGTNPCGEIPNSPNGVCLLGSLNLTKFVTQINDNAWKFDFDELARVIKILTRALDKIIDIGFYPLKENKEAHAKNRKIGIGLMGIADTIPLIDKDAEYGNDRFNFWFKSILMVIRDVAYTESIKMAREKEPFPLFDAQSYLASPFVKTLPTHIRQGIASYGIRNSHLLSIAPNGTISQIANCPAGGIEPVFSHEYDRMIKTNQGDKQVTVTNYAFSEWGLKTKSAHECSVDDHLNVQALAQKYVDQSISKTINIPHDYPWEDFKKVYTHAYDMGLKGVAVFRDGCKRIALLKTKNSNNACTVDAKTGIKSCGD